MKTAPGGRDLETALHELLRKDNFTVAEHLNVFVVGPKTKPVYIPILSPDVAKTLADLLATVLGRRTNFSLTEWVLFRPDVERF